MVLHSPPADLCPFPGLTQSFSCFSGGRQRRELPISHYSLRGLPAHQVSTVRLDTAVVSVTLTTLALRVKPRDRSGGVWDTVSSMFC